MVWKRILALLSVLVLVAFSTTGCSPDFPDCDTDEDCQESEEGQEQDRLYCVNNLCQQCRDDDDCEPGYECAAGSCEEIPGWCADDGDCTGNQVCRDNECGPECIEDDDCDEGYHCEGGNCVEEPDCTTDADCGPDEVCENQTCVAAPDEPDCELETVYFPFDSSELTGEARNILEANADCIQERDASVQIEGHCDERGTTEYNLALGERRANAVRDYLTTLGVSGAAIETTSYGDQQLRRSCGIGGSESCHQENRRAVFNLR